MPLPRTSPNRLLRILQQVPSRWHSFSPLVVESSCTCLLDKQVRAFSLKRTPRAAKVGSKSTPSRMTPQCLWRCSNQNPFLHNAQLANFVWRGVDVHEHILVTVSDGVRELVSWLCVTKSADLRATMSV